MILALLATVETEDIVSEAAAGAVPYGMLANTHDKRYDCIKRPSTGDFSPLRVTSALRVASAMRVASALRCLCP